MKKYILTGLIIFLPAVITLWIIHFFFNLLTIPFVGLIQEILDGYGIVSVLHPWIVFGCRILVLFLIFGLILVLGFVAQRLFFRWFVNLMHKVFLKIPIVKTLYKILVELTKSLFSPGTKPFKKTVMMDFPYKDARALGFITNDVPQSIDKGGQNIQTEDLKAVFLPTAPHPISGFLLITDNKNLKEVDISVEDVFKILVSCGAYHPHENKPPQSDTNANPS
ncbi:MAG: DUF502 domain-containing protein [Simkaniaceae bacterium]|nr:DUF502 domain-containing protein [Simkaniaceae bacterium]